MQEDLLYPKEPPRFNSTDIEDFISWCVKQNTSDITIQDGVQVFCEIHGKMKKVTKRRLTRAELIEIISFIYKGDGAISRLNGGSDVDMPWEIKVDRDTVLRFRINVTAIRSEGGHNGYQITIRTITSRAPLLETLNLNKDILNNISPNRGLIVVTGATGSGKSTLLASVLDSRMRDPDANLKILTYEAPIEYVYDDVDKPSTSIAQTEIDKHLGSFSLGVRNALRRKPSIIVLGELRDRETIGEAITASMTGHLVYGTLHTNGTADAIRRMVNAFDKEEKNSRAMDIISSIKLIVSQMLLPSTDGKRVAIREYLVFTEEVVDRLLNVDPDNLTYEVKKLLLTNGRTFLQEAQEKLDLKIITEKEFKEVERISKGFIKDMQNG